MIEAGLRMKQFVIISLVISALVGCSASSYVETSTGLESRTVDQVAAAKSRLTLAYKYIEIEDYQQAKINLDRAAVYTPEDPAVHLALAYYYQKVKETKKAESAYRRAARLAPSDGDIKNNYGAFLCDEKRFPEAEKQFLAAVESPGYIKIADSYENAGRCAFESGQKELALTYFQSSLAHSPHNYNLLLNLAELNYEMEDFTQAKKYLTKYEIMQDATPRSLWLAFKVANKLDKLAEAEKYSSQLLVTFPEAAETQKYIKNEY